MVKVDYYKCDFCRKTYKSKYATMKHEKECFHNPKNKTCGSCKFNDFGTCEKGLKDKGEIPVLQCVKYVEVDYFF